MIIHYTLINNIHSCFSFIYSDETCVLCHYCFTHSNHEGHDIAFYHAQAGGCCDCGDEDAWNKDGFCDLHGNRFIVICALVNV